MRTKNINPAKIIIAAVTTIWVIFSLLYIANDIWKDFKVLRYNTEVSYRSGYVTAINEVINLVEKNPCNIIPLHSGEKEISLVNIECVKNADTSEDAVSEGSVDENNATQ